MKQIKKTLVASSLFCFMLVGVVMADDMKHHQTVTFDKAVMIHNTLVKEGTYRVTFDVQNRQVKFRKSSNGDVVVIAPATVETMADKVEHDAVTTTNTESGTVVEKLVFEGHREAAILAMEKAAAYNSVPTNNNFSQQDWAWFYQQMGVEEMNYRTDEETTNEDVVNDEEMYCD